MNKSPLIKWKIAASLACLLLIFVGSAPAQLTVTSTDQYGSSGTYPFTPTWTPASDSLLLNLVPSTATGNFSLEDTGARSPNTLTQGGSLTINKITVSGNSTTSPNYVTCGPSGGTLLIYTLATNAYGYNLTNITVYGGWADNGRDAQGFTLWYSTVADPTNWIELTTVNYIPVGPGSTPTSTRTVINDASGALIAANVAQLKFDFTTPVPRAQDNNYVGEAAITAEGSAAPTPLGYTITTQTQQGSAVPFTPVGWPVETSSLIANELPSTAIGNFAYEDTNCNVDTLTQGGSLTINSITGNAGDSVNSPTTSINYVTCGGRTGLGSIIIYPLTNSAYGSDLTNIVVYNGWKDTGRMGQYYIVSYSTVAAPTTFIPITTINYLPSVASEPTANRVAITSTGTTPIAKGAAAIKFDFVDPYNAANFNNGFQGYAQIIVQGTNSATPPPPPSPVLVQDTLPNYATTIVGDSITFTATYSNTPPVNVQWQDVSGGVTNTFSSGVVNVTNGGVVISTLTVNNLQTSGSGFYRLAGFNATNGAAAPSYSTEAQLVVNPVPAAVGNIVMYYAEQDGLGPAGPVNSTTNLYPTWTVNTVNDLVDGFVTNSSPGVQGTSYPGTGNFNITTTGGAPCNPNPSVLSDGSAGYVSYWPNVGGNLTECSCGINGTGDTLTFTLPAAGTYGYDVTNISVYGGWGDAGRNEQKYQILYSTASAPTTFISLGTFDYNPSDPHGVESATRTMLIPVSGALAKNVYAVEINWNVSVGPKNGWEGYSEVVIQGTPSHQNPVLVQNTLPSFASTTVGDSISFSAAYSNAPAANLQWQVVQNGVTSNILGATSSTLTLSNLQVANTGYYQLEAVNAGDSQGIFVSSPSLLVVNTNPAPVAGIVTSFAEQDGLGAVSTVNESTNFFPTWVENTNNDLILGSVDGGFGNSGDVTPGNGSLNLVPECNVDPGVMSDGSIGYMTYWPGVEANSSLETLGVFQNSSTPYAGLSLTYTLPASSSGWSITNITVYGGWGGADHDEQKYQVLYSTVANPSVFINLTSVDFLPGNSNGWQAATRTMLTPASPTGILAQNVYAVEFYFNNQGAPPENDYEGYSEFVVAGFVSPNVPVLTQDITPATAEDVVGSSLILEASFSGATSYQWYKNGTNLPGATSPTLTLSNLQLTDTATNGGYKLVAINGAGTNVSSACKVVIDPAPVATNNVITAFAYQTSAAGGFGPTWDASALSSSLIYGQDPPFGGSDAASDFIGGGDQAGGLPVLTDGSYGTFASDGTHPAFAAGGVNAGQYVIYTLGSSSTGYTVTNIQIAGGWNDNGRDSQYYTISYSTVANPTTFTPLVAVQDNLQGYGVSDETTVRGTFTGANGVLAVDAYAVKVDFTTPPGVPNGYSGYSEISVFGSPSPAVVLPPVVSSPSVSGGNLIMTGTGGTPFTPYILITTTNLLTPLANWTTNTTGTLDGNGGFSNAIPINTSLPASFFTIKLQ